MILRYWYPFFAEREASTNFPHKTSKASKLKIINVKFYPEIKSWYLLV